MSKNVGTIQDNKKDVPPGELFWWSIDSSTGYYFTPEASEPEFQNRNSIPLYIVADLALEGLSDYRYAFLDTGMMINHPLIKPHLKMSKNFSQDFDIEDHNGHGTLVTLIALNLEELIGQSTPQSHLELYNLKVLNTKGHCSRNDMIEAIGWCAENRIKRANISAGFLDETCKGDCDVCETARKAKDVIISAATGNYGPGKTVCPAKAGVYAKAKNVHSIGEIDPSSGKVSLSSGQGTRYSPSLHSKRIPVKERMLNDGDRFIKRDQLSIALLCYSRAIKLDRSNVLAWYNTGYVLKRLQRIPEAIECYTEVLKIDPNYADAWNAKGAALDTLGNHKEAIQSY